MVVQRSSIFATDEELGKRDDDRNDRKHRRMGSWNVRQRPVSPWKKRRIAAIAAICFLGWLFIRNIPTDLKPIRQRYPYSATLVPDAEDLQRKLLSQNEKAQSPTSEKDQNTQVHNYNGPIKFVDLAGTLQTISYTVGFGSINQNVLFAASDLQSAAILIPIACEMASWRRNRVHMALMGRDETPLDDIKEMNGAKTETCDIHWHNARPDFAASSSSSRMEGSVAGALGHIDNFMKPQAVIVTDSMHEDGFFSKAIQWKAQDLGLPLIEIPGHSPESLSWLSRLGAMALRSWHKSSIEILIQVPNQSSGALVRLLRSLSAADYSGFDPPRLTIELPPKLESATQNFIKAFRWPPQKVGSYVQTNQLTIRRRIPETRLDPNTASVRFLESFYPSSANGPHVLVLSSQAELSRSFFHYLKLQLLEYKFSSASSRSSRDLMGISLETPSKYLNGSENFTPPAVPSKHQDEATKTERAATVLAPFLWQAPNAHAALYFSDKWVEIHSFLSKRDSAAHHPRTKAQHKQDLKRVSEKQPAWVEYVLEFMRIRGYYFLYPSLGSSVSTSRQSLSIIHNDLYATPEEFIHPEVPTEEFAVQTPKIEAGAALEAPADYLETHKSPETPGTNAETPLLLNLQSLLPATPEESHESRDHAEEENDIIHDLDDDEEDFPSFGFGVHGKPSMQPLTSLPLLDCQGESITRDDLEIKSREYAQKYRENEGGCSTGQASTKNIYDGSAEDLFCINEDEVEPFIEEAVVPPSSSPPSSSPPSSPPPVARPFPVNNQFVNRVLQRPSRSRFEDEPREPPSHPDPLDNLPPVEEEPQTHSRTGTRFENAPTNEEPLVPPPAAGTRNSRFEDGPTAAQQGAGTGDDEQASDNLAGSGAVNAFPKVGQYLGLSQDNDDREEPKVEVTDAEPKLEVVEAEPRVKIEEEELKVEAKNAETYGHEESLRFPDESDDAVHDRAKPEGTEMQQPNGREPEIEAGRVLVGPEEKEDVEEREHGTAGKEKVEGHDGGDPDDDDDYEDHLENGDELVAASL